MKNIVIVPNAKKDKELSVTAKLSELLVGIGMNVYIKEEYAAFCRRAVGYSVFPEFCELIIVVGGDGSVIDASGLAVEHDIPLIGVNMGRVGYLSEVDPDDLSVFKRLSFGEYSVKEKMLLSVSTSPSWSHEAYAVNDVIVSHGEYLGISSFRLEDALGNSLGYRADGVIFATPQGSTAYSFSSGGPVLAHDVEGILVTPVCPHSFFNRSVLFNSGEVLTVRNTGEHPMNIAVDGRKYTELLPNEACYIRRADCRLKTLTFSENKMFEELFKKMSVTEGLK
ncbi:MAG: NAD(+)/NADH kinase [Clostridia bacterium]|nr:NAD(+)/NADH kinase [Clostridia bacterium]